MFVLSRMRGKLSLGSLFQKSWKKWLAFAAWTISMMSLKRAGKATIKRIGYTYYCFHGEGNHVQSQSSFPRKFFRVYKVVGGQYQGITYYAQNTYAPDRVIYFICDVPYLVKTVRNNLEDSHGHQNSNQ